MLLCLRAILTLSLVGSVGFDSRAFGEEAKPDAEQTRRFPQQNCQYTLPGPGWDWQKLPIPKSVCAAENDRGILVGLTTVAAAPSAVWNQKSVGEYEAALYAQSKAVKRGGRFVTFRGLQCYQAEAVTRDGSTAVCRAILANRILYELTVVGGKEPVEKDPEFEKIMNGFSFIQPPTAHNDPAEIGNNPSKAIGSAVGFCLFGILILNWVTRKKPKRLTARRDFDDDEPAALSPVTSRSATGVAESTGPIKECKYCGFPRVALKTQTCPNCGKGGELPGIVARYAARGTLAGGILVCIAGAIWGNFFEDGVGPIILGVVAGSALGVCAGYMCGWTIGQLALATGRR